MLLEVGNANAYIIQSFDYGIWKKEHLDIMAIRTVNFLT